MFFSSLLAGECTCVANKYNPRKAIKNENHVWAPWDCSLALEESHTPTEKSAMRGAVNVGVRPPTARRNDKNPRVQRQRNAMKAQDLLFLFAPIFSFIFTVHTQPLLFMSSALQICTPRVTDPRCIWANLIKCTQKRTCVPWTWPAINLPLRARGRLFSSRANCSYNITPDWKFMVKSIVFYQPSSEDCVCTCSKMRLTLN